MSNPASINRRQWLKATGATLAGVVLATRLPASDKPEVPAQGKGESGAPDVNAPPRGEREYIHGFEIFPPT